MTFDPLKIRSPRCLVLNVIQEHLSKQSDFSPSDIRRYLPGLGNVSKVLSVLVASGILVKTGYARYRAR